MKKRTSLLFAIETLCALTGFSSVEFDLPAHIIGKMSNVYLLEIADLPSEYLKSRPNLSFDDGVYVAFLVVAKKKKATDLAFQNFRELTINGVDYFKATLEEEGSPPFAETSVADVEDYEFLDRDRKLPKEWDSKKPSVIIYSYISGKELGDISSLTIPIFVGWSRSGEKLVFELSVEGGEPES